MWSGALYVSESSDHIAVGFPLSGTTPMGTLYVRPYPCVCLRVKSNLNDPFCIFSVLTSFSLLSFRNFTPASTLNLLDSPISLKIGL